MSGKSSYSHEEIAQYLAQLRGYAHLTFTQACHEIGISAPTVRYWLNHLLPRLRGERPDIDWTVPEFAGVAVLRPVKQTADDVRRDNDGLRKQLHDARTTIAGFDKKFADQKWIKETLYGLKDKTVIPPDWLIHPQKVMGSPGIPAMMWSDWHWGEVVKREQVNDYNEFNLVIAHDRARRLVERTIMLLRHYMVHPSYEGIVVNLGGDMVSGNIHEELVNTNAVPIMAAVVDLWGVLEWALRQLADEFGKIVVFCVTGNHGRDTRKMQSKDRAFTSFDWLIYAHLEHAFKDDKRVTIIAPQASDILYALYGHRYLLTHGDQFRGGDGMIGHIGPVTRGQKKKLSRDAEIGREFSTMIHGHFHTYSPGDRIIGNGSLCGYNQYAADNNFGFEDPKQAMWITHPQHGITFHIPVFVNETPTIEKSAAISWAEVK